MIKTHPPLTACYIHEAALRELPVDGETRWSQYLGLLLAIGSAEAKVRIIPTGKERTIESGGFSLLRFTEFPPLVCRPAETVTLILEGDEHVGRYERIVIELDKISLSELESRELIAELVAETEKTATPSNGMVTNVADTNESGITG